MTSRPFAIAAVVIGSLAAVILVSVTTFGFRLSGKESTASLPGKQADSSSPALVLGTDVASQYKRGLNFWKLGDYRQAFPWLKAAADRGHREARYYLGLSFLYGRATIQNYRLALEQFQQSARQGVLNSQYQLGVMYRDGMGVPTNREQAYVWLNIAASRGLEEATLERDKLATFMSAREITEAQDDTLKEVELMHGQLKSAAKLVTVDEMDAAP